MPSYKSEIKKIARAVLWACTKKHQHMHKINRRFALTYEAPNPPYQRMLQATVCDPCSIRHSRKVTERRKLCFRIQMWTRTKRFCSKAPRTPAFRSPSTPTGVWDTATGDTSAVKSSSAQLPESSCPVQVSWTEKPLTPTLVPKQAASPSVLSSQPWERKSHPTGRKLRCADYVVIEPQAEETMTCDYTETISMFSF